MHYVNKKVWQQLRRLIELKNLGDDLYDTATRIKENKEYEFDELNDFIDNQPASSETVQLEILRYVHFYEANFELEKEPVYIVKVVKKETLRPIKYYYHPEFSVIDWTDDMFYPKFENGFTKEDAEKLAEIVSGEIVVVE